MILQRLEWKGPQGRPHLGLARRQGHDNVTSLHLYRFYNRYTSPIDSLSHKGGEPVISRSFSFRFASSHFLQRPILAKLLRLSSTHCLSMASEDEFHTPTKTANSSSIQQDIATTPLSALLAKYDRSVSPRVAEVETRSETLAWVCVQELKQIAGILDYRDLQYSGVSGLYVLPDPCDARLWHGVVHIRAGAYKGGCFRFHLRMAPDHPAEGAYPTVQFVDPVFHPLVSSEVRAGV